MRRCDKRIIFYSFLIFGLVIVLFSCNENPSQPKAHDGDFVTFDLDSIRKRGKIILLTENSASTYFLYRNQAKGFDYEMVRSFAKHLQLELEVRILDDVDKMFELLNSGQGDIIASNLTITPSRAQRVNFTNAVYQTRQVLVQRKIYAEANARYSLLVRDSSELDKLPVWVHRYSSFYERLTEIEQLTGLNINIQEAPGEISTDDLIRLVNDGALPATITDENLASMEQLDYEDIDISVHVTPYQDIAWATRKNSPMLLNELNSWLSSKKTEERIAKTYEKYFPQKALASERKDYVMPNLAAGSISPFDSIFKMHSGLLGWDWRMLAALAYQESRFNPEALSWSGASGLMQLMPETSARFGCETLTDPECSVRASVKYLKYLQTLWKKRVSNPSERDKFVLASYNIGQGHIIDAQNLARELGMADTIWDGNVAEALLLKQQEKYYTMACVKHGYCHAKEPYHFVPKILALFEHFKTAQ